MYLLYVDESGHSGTDLDNPQQPILSLSGIAVEDKEWYNLNYIFEKKNLIYRVILKTMKFMQLNYLTL